jgi:hypothetical protein
MRARQRHFNPKSAGAVAAYDARFISGLSDGDNVSTWASRTGTNDATQTTVGNQPNYETNEINGQPVVNFLPVNSDSLVINITIPNNISIIKVFRRNTSGTNSSFFTSSSSARYDSWWFSDNITYTAPASGFNTHGTADTSTGSFVESWIKNGTTSSQVWRNGSTVGTSQIPTTSNGSYNALGRGAGGTVMNGAVGCASLLDSALSDSARRRLEHAAAYSFKIACN